MLRYARTPGGTVAVDALGHAAGRGTWTCCELGCIQQASDRGGFARSYRAAVQVNAEALKAQAHNALLSQTLNTLGLAYRARQCTVGPMPASEWVREGTALALVVANDLSPQLQEELAAARDKSDPVPMVLPGPTASQMKTALGHGPAEVVAIGRGALGRQILKDIKRVAPLAAWSDDSLGVVGAVSSQR